jgi:hypothetical protein
LKEERKHPIREQVQDHFRNGVGIAEDFLNKSISQAMSDKRNHGRQQLRNYLNDSPLPCEEIKAKGCPEGVTEEQWNFFLEEEL